MRYAQLSRLERIHSQTFYLIEKIENVVNNTTKVYEFKISGSTANLYNVIINLGEMDELMTCNCPDAHSHAKTQGVKCKHCCFVWVKVLNLIPDGLEWNILNGEQKNVIEAACGGMIRDELINKKLQAKYYQLVNKKFNDSNGKKLLHLTKKEIDKFVVTKDLENEEYVGCPICFDDMKPENSSQCPTCKNVVHTDCIKKWLSVGHRNCVYCRGDWSEFDKKTRNKNNKNLVGLAAASAAANKNGYLNLEVQTE